MMSAFISGDTTEAMLSYLLPRLYPGYPRSVGQRGVCVAATVGHHAAGSVCTVDSQFFHQWVELTISPVVNVNPIPARTGDQVVFLASRKVKGKHIRHYL